MRCHLEAFTLGVDEAATVHIANLINCQGAKFPISYLGLPCSDKQMLASDWDPTASKVVKRVDPWQGKFMSSDARLTLTNTCLSAIPTFTMCLFILGDGVHVQLDKVRARFF